MLLAVGTPIPVIRNRAQWLGLVGAWFWRGFRHTARIIAPLLIPFALHYVPNFEAREMSLRIAGLGLQIGGLLFALRNILVTAHQFNLPSIAGHIAEWKRSFPLYHQSVAVEIPTGIASLASGVGSVTARLTVRPTYAPIDQRVTVVENALAQVRSQVERIQETSKRKHAVFKVYSTLRHRRGKRATGRSRSCCERLPQAAFTSTYPVSGGRLWAQRYRRSHRN
jgi:hypothetical protein